jgi:hypothetical protein
VEVGEVHDEHEAERRHPADGERGDRGPGPAGGAHGERRGERAEHEQRGAVTLPAGEPRVGLGQARGAPDGDLDDGQEGRRHEQRGAHRAERRKPAA